MVNIKNSTVSSHTPCFPICGISALRDYLNYNDFIYVLHALYKMVLYASRVHDDKERLHRRLSRFEYGMQLPGYLSSMPIEEFLEELEDAQFVYGLFRAPIELPKFH